MLQLSQFYHIYHYYKSHNHVIQENIIEDFRIDNII